MKALRETAAFRATKAKTGILITAKEPNVTPRQRTISEATWHILRGLTDSEFNGSICMELGIGVFRRT